MSLKFEAEQIKARTVLENQFKEEKEHGKEKS
jgi:hypothetical protein